MAPILPQGASTDEQRPGPASLLNLPAQANGPGFFGRIKKTTVQKSYGSERRNKKMSRYVNVPVEPTDKMIAAGVKALSMVGHHAGREYTNEEKIKNVWPKMVEAAFSENGDRG